MAAPTRPTKEEIEAAAQRLADVLLPTPLLPLPDWHGDGAPGGAGDLWLKPEVLQHAGCFKVRGVYNAVERFTPEERAAGVSTVSAGNTAKALAWSARRFGVPARSLMPDTAPRTKIDAVRALGGEPVLVPTAEVFAYLKERRWRDEPYAFVDPWISRDVMIGHGSLGLEILRDLPGVDTVYVPVGGGGLLGGVGSALKAAKPSVRVVAVEPAGCPSLHAARAAGHPVDVACDTMCDGVAVPYITDEMYPLLTELADDCVLVGEDEVRAAIRLLARSAHLIAEGSGALALAAALRTPPEERGTSVCLVTGGSIDPTQLATILEESDPPRP